MQILKKKKAPTKRYGNAALYLCDITQMRIVFITEK